MCRLALLSTAVALYHLCSPDLKAKVETTVAQTGLSLTMSTTQQTGWNHARGNLVSEEPCCTSAMWFYVALQ